MAMEKRTCRDCGERKSTSQFASSKKMYTYKNGETVEHEGFRRVCRPCQARQAALQRVAKEALGRRYNSGVSLSLRTVLTIIKREMNNEDSFEMKYAWAAVGIQLNNLLLKL
jgi:hypothetical protein